VDVLAPLMAVVRRGVAGPAMDFMDGPASAAAMGNDRAQPAVRLANASHAENLQDMQ
jgi:hypothetical protein